MNQILPPDSPPDIYPLPFEKRRVENCLPLRKNMVASLKEAGVRTLGDLDTYFRRGGKLIDLAGIGPKSNEQILETWKSLQETRR